jgi:hypothetical protein
MTAELLKKSTKPVAPEAKPRKNAKRNKTRTPAPAHEKKSPMAKFCF